MRESGFYWVLDRNGEWMVAEWFMVTEEWFMTGAEESIPDGYWLAIAERCNKEEG